MRCARSSLACSTSRVTEGSKGSIVLPIPVASGMIIISARPGSHMVSTIASPGANNRPASLTAARAGGEPS